MEEKIEEKLKLDADIASARKQLKDTLADLEIAKKEQVALEAIKERSKALIDEKNEELRQTSVLISDQKSAWAGEKSAELAQLEVKKSEVDKVLARFVELDKKQAEIDAKIAEDKVTLDRDYQTLNSIQNEKVAIDVTERQISDLKMATEAKEVAIDDKIAKFKAGVERVINELAQI